MGLREVKKGLENELEQRKREILEEAEKHRVMAIQKAREQIREYREEAEKQARHDMERMEKSELASANLTAKKQALDAKKQALDAAFGKAKERLVSLPRKGKARILNSMVKKAEQEIDVGKVICNKSDTSLIEGYSTGTADIEGGVVCESKDGSSRVDLAFSTLLADVRETHLKKISERLL